MNFNQHWELEGKHSFLSPSKYHWVNYTEDRLLETYSNFQAVKRGTRLHEFAKDCIELGIKLPRSRQTLNMYVNDAIGYRMTPEQPLYFSDNCFGTADAISFRKNILRIHDLKTGATPASMMQLMVYASIFFLEYDLKPGDVKTELRIYQSNEISEYEPEVDEILPIMDTIVRFDRIIEEAKKHV